MPGLLLEVLVVTVLEEVSKLEEECIIPLLGYVGSIAMAMLICWEPGDADGPLAVSQLSGSGYRGLFIRFNGDL
jgi:hypothetical protein